MQDRKKELKESVGEKRSQKDSSFSMVNKVTYRSFIVLKPPATAAGFLGIRQTGGHVCGQPTKK